MTNSNYSDWKTFLEEKKESLRYQKIINLLIMSAEDIEPVPTPPITWYQVVEYDEEGKGKVYGFAVKDSIVIDAPNWGWVGHFISEVKKAHFTKGKNISVSKIADTWR